jgi:hypothetical protein
MCEAVPRCGPHGQLAISRLTAGAKEAPPCVPARRDIPPTLSLGEAHGSLYVLVGMNRTGHPRLQTSTIGVDSRSASKLGERGSARQAESGNHALTGGLQSRRASGAHPEPPRAQQRLGIGVRDLDRAVGFLPGHQRRRPSRLAITDSGSGRAAGGAWASSL